MWNPFLTKKSDDQTLTDLRNLVRELELELSKWKPLRDPVTGRFIKHDKDIGSCG